MWRGAARGMAAVFCAGTLLSAAAGQGGGEPAPAASSAVLPPASAGALAAGAVGAARAAQGLPVNPGEEGYLYALPDDFSLIVSPPDMNLQPEALVWAGKTRGVRKVAKSGPPPSPQINLRTQTADGRLVYWQTGILSIDVSGLKAGSRDLTEAADIKLVLPAVSMDARLTASAGKDPDNPDLWQKHVAEVEMQVTAVPKTDVRLTGADEFTQTYRDAASLGDSGTTAHLLQNERRSAGLSATVSPLDKTTLTVGMNGENRITKDSTASDRSDKTITTVETQSEKAFVSFRWQPLSWTNFEVTARAHNTGILWRSTNTKSGTFSTSEPRAAMAFDLGDTKLSVSMERSATDYNADTFVAYARTAGMNETVPVKPDNALQFRTELSQKIGDAQVSAVYAHARDGTVTEFGFSGTGAQAPVSTDLRRRDEVGVRLDMPLESLGLDDTVVAGHATWRDSLVRDPLTGKYRRASGEVPSNVQLRLERRLPGQNIRLGLTGDLSAGQTIYQTKEISQTEASRKLGAFFAYRPDAYEIDLDVDGLVGTPDTTNYFYEGARTVNQIPRVQSTPAQGPTVKLSLKRSF